MTTAIPSPFDLGAYLARIGLSAPVPATLDGLSQLVAAHMACIPFENLDVLLGRPIRLDLDSLQRKLVTARRGGYCFEHVTLFAAALDAMGFRAQPHIARVTLVTPRTHSPRTHMLLTVALSEGPVMVDPGLGSRAPGFPVPVTDAGADPGGGLTHWLVRDGPDWMLRVRTSDGVLDAWVSRLEADPPIDFEVGNHYTATHPASIFRNRLMLRTVTPEGFVTVMNRDVSLWRGLQPETRRLEDRDDLRALLRDRFGFDLPEIDRLRIPAIPEWD